MVYYCSPNGIIKVLVHEENSQKAKGNSLVVQAMEGFNFNVHAIFKVATAYWLIVDGTDQ